MEVISTPEINQMHKRGATSSPANPVQALPHPETAPGSDLTPSQSQQLIGTQQLHSPLKNCSPFLFLGSSGKAGEGRACSRASVTNLQHQSHEGPNKSLLEMNPASPFHCRGPATCALGSQCS